MAETLWRAVWFFVVACAIAYACFLVVGSITNAASSTAGPSVIRDVVGADSHDLSGMIVVPSSCDQLISRSEELSSNEFELVFSTWQDPSVQCTGGNTPRSFHMSVFAPATGITFVATLDGQDIPIAVIPVPPSSP